MHNSDQFINWLEGYFDASKNKLTPPQVREIRKKISEYQAQPKTIPLWDSAYNGNTIPGSAYSTYTNTTAVNEEFIEAIEKNKSASTMEDLA